MSLAEMASTTLSEPRFHVEGFAQALAHAGDDDFVDLRRAIGGRGGGWRVGAGGGHQGQAAGGCKQSVVVHRWFPIGTTGATFGKDAAALCL